MKNRTTAVFWSLDFDSHLGKFCTQLLVILHNIFFFLDFVKLYLLTQLHPQNTFQHLIQNLPLIYKQCREENTIKKSKKYQQYFKTWKEWATAHQLSSRWANTYDTLSIIKNTERPHVSNSRCIVLCQKVFP